MLNDEIREFQIRAKQFESDVRKGRTPSEDDCQTVCMSYKNIVNGLAETYPEEDFKKEIDSKCYTLSPALVPFYIKEIVVDLADLAKRAFLLMIENMKTPRKPKEQEPNPAVKPNQENIYDATQKSKDKSKRKTKDKEYEADGPDKMSIQARNNLKIKGDYAGNLDNIKTAQSREQKAATERAQRAQTERVNQAAREQAASEPEQTLSFGE